LATIVSNPFFGSGIVQNGEILRKNGIQIKKVGINDSKISGRSDLALPNILQI
jgi:hypothetical protein